MFILASTSPRRKELMKKIIKTFKIVEPKIDERSYSFELSNYAYELSKLKAYEVFSRYPNDEVFACDTVVIFNNKIINKPKDDKDAKRILKLLSDKKHFVISSYTYISKNKEINRTVKTEVIFNKLSKELINEYVSKGLSKGKAGAYGIQDNYPLVKEINGSYDNVMGLPTEDIKKHIKFK